MKYIPITTTQNVVIECQPATIFERGVAQFLDTFLIVLLCVFIDFELYTRDLQRYLPMGIGVLFFLLNLGVMFGYHILSEYMWNGQSPGKRLLGLRVIRLDGQRTGLFESVIRAILLLVDFFFTSGTLGGLVIATSRLRQRLGDMAAGTVVVKAHPSAPVHLKEIEEITSREEMEFRYPQVVKFTEQDMLLVKEMYKRTQTNGNAAHQHLLHALARQLAEQLGLEEVPADARSFVRQVIREYIVLTR